MGERFLKLLPYIGLALLAVVFVLPFPGVLEREAWQPLYDIAHLPVFAALALWLMARLQSGAVPRAGLLTVLLTAAVAIAVELVQPLSGRSGSASDALIGIAGALIAVTGRHVWRPRRSLATRIGQGVVGLGLGVAVLWTPLTQLGAVWWQARSLPVLGDFEGPLERHLWRPYPVAGGVPEACPGAATHGARSLVLRTIPGVFSGVRYQANDSDWGAYERLVFDLYLPAGGPRLSIRIDDDGDTTEHASRFNRPLDPGPGWNHITIPLAEIAAGPAHRRLNLGAIRQLLIFAGPRESEPGLFCLDHVRLE